MVVLITFVLDLTIYFVAAEVNGVSITTNGIFPPLLRPLDTYNIDVIHFYVGYRMRNVSITPHTIRIYQRNVKTSICFLILRTPLFCILCRLSEASEFLRTPTFSIPNCFSLLRKSVFWGFYFEISRLCFFSIWTSLVRP